MCGKSIVRDLPPHQQEFFRFVPGDRVEHVHQDIISEDDYAWQEHRERPPKTPPEVFRFVSEDWVEHVHQDIMSAAQVSIESRICAKIDSVVLHVKEKFGRGFSEMCCGLRRNREHEKSPHTPEATHPTSQQHLQHQ